jgi:hypothetical protein
MQALAGDGQLFVGRDHQYGDRRAVGKASTGHHISLRADLDAGAPTALSRPKWLRTY